MVQGVTGNIFASSGRDLPTVQPTDQAKAGKDDSNVNHAIKQMKTDTVSISKEALEMSKGAEKSDDRSTEGSEKQ